MNAKHFAALFLAAYAALTVSVLGLAAWLEPFEGDLTRIGGKSENRYGWNAPQPVFSRNLGRYWAPGGQDYSGEDVVVFGDSFSHMGLDDGRHFGWQNFFIAATGQSVLTFNHGNRNIEDWLKEQSPEGMPDLVIFQRVERGLYENTAEGPCKPNVALSAEESPQWITNTLAGERLQRPEKIPLDLPAAVHWLRINLENDPEVQAFALTRSDLFSSTVPQEILLYEDDFLLDEKRQRGLDEQGLACYLESLRQLVEANGRSRFLVAIAPDKTSVYRPFMAAAPAGDNLFQRLGRAGFAVLRFDRIFQQAAADGVQDLYLPNDTHWGSEGNRLFASVLVDLLRTAARKDERLTQAPHE